MNITVTCRSSPPAVLSEPSRRRASPDQGRGRGLARVCGQRLGGKVKHVEPLRLSSRALGSGEQRLGRLLPIGGVDHCRAIISAQ